MRVGCVASPIAVGQVEPTYRWVKGLKREFCVSPQGNYSEAEGLYNQGKGIIEKTAGRKHPDYSKGLNDLARLQQLQVRFTPAYIPNLLPSITSRVASGTDAVVFVIYRT